MGKKLAIYVALVSWCLFASGSARAGEIIDRIVATVNGHIILQSDWDDALCFEAFTAGHSVQQMTASDRKADLDRLIDQELLREQMRASDFRHATDAEVASRIQEIRKQYPGAESDQGWHGLLSRYALSADDLKKRVAMELDLLRLVDARLRPGVEIDSKVIESYYKIKELLTQKKLNQLLTSWLENLRAGSEIHSDNALLPSGGQSR